MKRSITGILLLLTLLPLQAQYNFRFQQEYFFGNLPSARTEAMGRADVAVGATANSLYFNPAGLGGIQTQEVALSTSGPFYVLKESDFYFASYAKRIHPKLVTAVSFNQLAIGPTTFTTDINGEDYEIDNPRSTNLALSAAAEPIPGLHIGLNANLFGLKYFDDAKNTKSFMLDAGALYRLTLVDENEKQQLFQAGISVTNITGSDIKLISPTGDEASNVLPILARVGIAYIAKTQISLPGAGEGPLALTLTAEYQNVLNNEYRTGLFFGSEAVIWDVLALRLGYFNSSQDDFGVANNRDRLRDLTYGFGFQIPLNELAQDGIPFDLHFDYVSLKHAPTIYSGSRTPNLRTFSFRLVFAK